MNVPSNVELLRFSDADALARAAAVTWLRTIERAKCVSKPHAVALSGGRIMNKLFAEVVTQVQVNRVTFEHVHFFWADERCVPPDNPESNFHLARQSLFQPLRMPAEQIHRIQGELEPELAAAQAEQELHAVVATPSGRPPMLDLVLLGMGEDGHVASLFPDETEVVQSIPAVFRAVRNSPKPPRYRVTLGYGVIAAAREVWVLASGAGKEAALRESLKLNQCAPLGRIIALRSSTRVFSDIRLAPDAGADRHRRAALSSVRLPDVTVT